MNQNELLGTIGRKVLTTGWTYGRKALQPRDTGLVYKKGRIRTREMKIVS